MTIALNPVGSTPIIRKDDAAPKDSQVKESESSFKDLVDFQNLNPEEGRKLFQRIILESLNSPDLAEAIGDVAKPLSNSGLADQIYSGITGGIYAGFLNQNPEPTKESFLDFMKQVRSGVERGAGEARQILSSLGALNEGFDSDIDESLSLLADRLDQFEADTLGSLFGGSEDDNA